MAKTAMKKITAVEILHKRIQLLQNLWSSTCIPEKIRNLQNLLCELVRYKGQIPHAKSAGKGGKIK